MTGNEWQWKRVAPIAVWCHSRSCIHHCFLHLDLTGHTHPWKGPWTTVGEHWTMTWINNNLLLFPLKQSSCIIKGGCDGTFMCFTPSISISKDHREPKRGCLDHLSAPLDVQPGNPLSPKGPLRGKGLSTSGSLGHTGSWWGLRIKRSFCCLSKISPKWSSTAWAVLLILRRKDTFHTTPANYWPVLMSKHVSKWFPE